MSVLLRIPININIRKLYAVFWSNNSSIYCIIKHVWVKMVISAPNSRFSKKIII